MRRHERPVAMATAVLASHLGGGADAVRERVDAAVAGALRGVEVVEIPAGWSADELLEQVALHAAMDFMFYELHTQQALVQTRPV